MSGDINKEELMAIMADKLVLLRKNLKLKQGELAKKAGNSRQTLSDLESQKRSMSWNTYLALLSFFREDNSTNDLLEHFGIYTPELRKYLISPEQNK